MAQSIWKTLWSSLKKFKIKLPHSSNPLLGIYSKKMWKLTWKHICTPMFIAALFIIVKKKKKKRKQPRYLSPREQIKKLWYNLSNGLYQVMNRNNNLLFEITRVDLEGIMLTETSQIEDKYQWPLSYIES